MSEGIKYSISDTVISTVDQFVDLPPYHACLILVNTEIPKLNAAADQLIRMYRLPVVSVGGLLAKPLLKLTPRRRPSQVSRMFAEGVNEFKAGSLVCKDIDLLFEPSLRLDPLRLLLDISRQKALIVAWPGTFAGNTLAYAVPDHAHYRFWSDPELCDYCIVTL